MTLISREILQRALQWSKKRKILTALFAVYIFAVLWLTLLDRQWGERQAELMPFWEVQNLFENIGDEYLRKFWLGQIFGNIAMFIPFGVLLPYLCGITKFRRVFLMALVFSAGIEITQYITGRGLCEFDDVFNNTLGACVGYTAWRLKMRYNEKYKNEQSPW
mgnify:CR=1 FL=1